MQSVLAIPNWATYIKTHSLSILLVELASLNMVVDERTD